MRFAATPLDLLLESTSGEGSVGLLWLGQSGFALRIAGALVLVDPFLSPRPDRRFPPPIAPEDGRSVDLIAITHEHWDHLDAASLPALCAASPRSRVLVPEPIVELVTKLGIPAGRVVGMQPDSPFRTFALTIHAIPACHGIHASDAYTFGTEHSGGLYRYLGYVFDRGGVSLYHAGDTIGYDGLAARLRRCNVDICLLPINGRDAAREDRDIVGNLDCGEAAALASEAGADVVVPMHYDMFAANPGFPDRLVAAAQQLDRKLHVLVPARGRPFVCARARR